MELSLTISGYDSRPEASFCTSLSFAPTRTQSVGIWDRFSVLSCGRSSPLVLLLFSSFYNYHSTGTASVANPNISCKVVIGDALCFLLVQRVVPDDCWHVEPSVFFKLTYPFRRKEGHPESDSFELTNSDEIHDHLKLILLVNSA